MLIKHMLTIWKDFAGVLSHATNAHPNLGCIMLSACAYDFSCHYLTFLGTLTGCLRVALLPRINTRDKIHTFDIHTVPMQF